MGQWYSTLHVRTDDTQEDSEPSSVVQPHSLQGKDADFDYMIKKLVSENDRVWLTDDTINAYVKYLCEVKGIKRKGTAVFESYAIEMLPLGKTKSLTIYGSSSNCDSVVFPVNTPGHWVVVEVLSTGLVRIYDSLTSGQDTLSTGEKTLARDCLALAQEKKLISTDVVLMVCKMNGIPQQTDASSCGVFACYYIEQILDDAFDDVLIGQVIPPLGDLDVKVERKKIADRLLDLNRLNLYPFDVLTRAQTDATANRLAH
jgi:Ulp1 family protease